MNYHRNAPVRNHGTVGAAHVMVSPARSLCDWADNASQRANAERDYATAERGAIQRALARTGGNVSAAAADLGISRATLHRKLNRLGLS